MNDLLEFSQRGEALFGELTVRKQESGYLVYGPGRKAEEQLQLSDADFREWVRTSDDARYRPLSGQRGLRSGWCRSCRDERELEQCVSMVYPLAIEHSRQQALDRLRVVSEGEVLARQTGLYAGAANTTQEERDAVREELCSRCVRSPVWGGERGDIPCPEPCSCYVALCKEVATWHDTIPEATDEDPRVGFAEFHREGNGVRESVLKRLRTIG